MQSMSQNPHTNKKPEGLRHITDHEVSALVEAFRLERPVLLKNDQFHAGIPRFKDSSRYYMQGREGRRGDRRAGRLDVASAVIGGAEV